MPKATKEKKGRTKTNKNNLKSKKDSTKKGTKDEKFSFDEEIVIGLRRIDDEPEEKIKDNKTKRNQKTKVKKKEQKAKKQTKPQERTKQLEEPDIIIKTKYMQNYESEEETHNTNSKKDIKNRKNEKKKNKPTKKLTKKQQLSKKRRKLIIKIIKWLTLVGIIIAGIVYAMLSPIFNIKNISVIGNAKISSETIISLSGLSIGQNIFNFRTSNIVDNIKENAYIDSVDINRKIPDGIEIVVSEREATYMLTFGNAYVYINNQGYILEITAKEGNYPLLVGYSTAEEQIQEGNRLNTEDLEKLGDVLRIMDTASSMESKLDSLITQIDISDKSNYVLILEKEKKRVYLGDTTNLSTKILWINELLESEKDKEGVIYLNVDLNTERPYFREKV